jgi:hypothetical protein
MQSRSQAPGDSAFKSQLHDAIQERKGRSGTKDAKQGDAGKKDSPKPPITVAVVQPAAPPAPAASFGLPSAGVEAGSSTDGASNKSIAVEPAPIDIPTAVNPPAPPPEPAQTDSKELAFALRLTDLTPDREAHPAEAAQQPQPPAKSIPSDLLPQPAIATQQLSAPTTAAQKADSAITTPLKTSQPAQQSAAAAAPVIAIVPQRQGASAESGSHSSGGGASDKEASKHLQPQPLADSKSFRLATATSEAVSSVAKQSATPGPTLTAATPAPLTTPAPESAASVPAALTMERVSIPPAAPIAASRVTDVSVNIQVPRADASGDDRVAIRMSQVGSEIHVSVRTPDNQVAQSLRQDLGKLTTGLDQGGFRTETWRPAPANAAAQSNTNPQHQPQPDSSNREGGGSNGRSGGNSSQGSGEQKRRQQDERPRWVAELEQQKNQ